MTEPPSSPEGANGAAGTAGEVGNGENVLANLRHSLRTPLNQILGYSEMLQEEAAELGCVVELLDLQKVHAAGQQLLALINESLSPARVRSGRFDLSEFRRDARTLLNLIVGYSGLCGENLVDPRHRQACEDLVKIETAAANLLGFLERSPVLETLAQQGQATAFFRLSAAGRGLAHRHGGDRGGRGQQGLVGTLLVVDDDAMNRDLLLRRLERQGHKVLWPKTAGARSNGSSRCQGRPDPARHSDAGNGRAADAGTAERQRNPETHPGHHVVGAG
jgi:hypothetical protein